MAASSPHLTAARIQFTDEALTWREAVRLCGQPLVADGSVEASYLDAVVETAEKMGPYFDLGGGVAMPHARPEAGVHRRALSFLRTRRPVLLLDLQDHPIDVFIMLAALDSDSHIETIQLLAGVLMDPERVKRLKDATTPADVLRVFDEE